MSLIHIRSQRAAIFGASILSLVIAAPRASAATSILNSLTGFTGNSTLPATQAALAAAGLNFTSTVGQIEDPPGSGEFIQPTVQMDSGGAHFGDLINGDGGRNYIRTLQSDYANVSFVAEVTWETFDMFSQSSYFGLGSGEPGSFRIADWATPFSAVHLFQEVDPLFPRVFTLKNDDGVTRFDAGTTVTGLDTGTNRLRLSYDWFRKTATFAIDVNYAGGPFTADVTLPAVSTLSLYHKNGWPSEPARVYFGGDDGTVFKDLQLTVTSAATVFGDFNMDNVITSADWIILRNNQLANLSGKTHAEAYFLGDVTADLANDHADFAAFKGLYDAANGVGAFAAMLATVPEPSTIVLFVVAGALARPDVRQPRRKTI